MLDVAAPDSVGAVRRLGPMVRFGEAMGAQSLALKQFLLQNLYRHPRVMDMTQQARTVVSDLFAAYRDAPQQMQAGFAARAALLDASRGAAGVARVVADYVAGMTDRFAGREHARLTGRKLLV